MCALLWLFDMVNMWSEEDYIVQEEKNHLILPIIADRTTMKRMLQRIIAF